MIESINQIQGVFYFPKWNDIKEAAPFPSKLA